MRFTKSDPMRKWRWVYLAIGIVFTFGFGFWATITHNEDDLAALAWFCGTAGGAAIGIALTGE